MARRRTRQATPAGGLLRSAAAAAPRHRRSSTARRDRRRRYGIALAAAALQRKTRLITATDDVPSPIDFRDVDQARDWESKAEQRPGRSEILERLTEEAARLTGGGDRILELGSGPGFLAKRLLDRLQEVTYTALDFSPAMHELARQRLGPAAERVTFVERSFKTSDWPDGLGLFDLVVTNQAVHELRHKVHASALHRQVFEALRPGGSYLVADHFSDPGGMTNAELYMTRDEQQAALGTAGFQQVDRLAVAGTIVLHCARKDQ